MASSYGTRKYSAIHQSPQVATTPLPISATAPYSPQVHAAGSPLLGTSVGKQKRPGMGPAKSTRRLSTSTQAQLRPGALSQSVPASLISAGARARSSSVSQTHAHAHFHAEEDLGDQGSLDQAAPTKGKRKDKGQTYECEKCSKVYRHSTCLTKHRWEHTEHWKEASKLLLSKHQQVQLLEGAAILAAASAGSSLPDEKSFWPAAVSPPSSGLLGAAQGIHSLSFGSPRWGPSSLVSDVGDYDRSELDDIESDDDDDMSPEPRSGSADDQEDQEMENGMFTLDLEGSGELPPGSPLPMQHARLINGARTSDAASSDASSSRASSRPGMRSMDSAYGSIGRSSLLKGGAPALGATAAAVEGNALGVTGATPPTSLLGSQQHLQATRAVQGFFVPGQGQ